MLFSFPGTTSEGVQLNIAKAMPSPYPYLCSTPEKQGEKSVLFVIHVELSFI